MNRRDLLTRAALLAGGLGGAWWLRDNVLWRDPAVSFGADGTSGWVPYDAPYAATPTALVTIAGQTVRALIDSGAQYSVIDSGLFDALGLTRALDLPLVAYGVGGGAQMGRGTTLQIALGDMRIADLRAAILALGPLAMREGLSAPLILGQDVLGEAVLELDTAGRRLRFHARSGHVLPSNVLPVVVGKSRGALETEVTVEGARVQAVIDTGASALIALGRETAQNAGLLDGRPVRRGSSIVLGGAIASQLVRARTVTVGDQLYRDVETAIYADVALPGFPKALVGMEAFEGRRLVIDLGGTALHTSRPMDLTVG
ncbi:retroviral-like aspartic protease family protein [Brevundimonas sp. AJA228-03]|uniref:retropepsin-like aspartic protease n=1 Tax=Brevundimonas sp. AJA228-03 TaxID=2752515 RepID=UPI001AE02743|nr:retropepsin-like aspartic protease [Brevundimonas sp. AJA228-03]QTN19410.1 retroviral-like aspartic protease family protein [Brevundimonas sp. AJA228-03]